jgi:NAD(P)-dependent dehydrogenase (short-subunit alcohol dehydrogenase family)
VRVNCVSLGLIVTEGSFKVVFGGSQEKLTAAAHTIAVNRLGQPEDVAWACHFLLSPAASFISGAVLTVDGGEREGPVQRLSRALSWGDHSK